jgi:hypothetical protein
LQTVSFCERLGDSVPDESREVRAVDGLCAIFSSAGWLLGHSGDRVECRQLWLGAGECAKYLPRRMAVPSVNCAVINKKCGLGGSSQRVVQSKQYFQLPHTSPTFNLAPINETDSPCAHTALLLVLLSHALTSFLLFAPWRPRLRGRIES